MRATQISSTHVGKRLRSFADTLKYYINQYIIVLPQHTLCRGVVASLAASTHTLVGSACCDIQKEHKTLMTKSRHSTRQSSR